MEVTTGEREDLRPQVQAENHPRSPKDKILGNKNTTIYLVT